MSEKGIFIEWRLWRDKRLSLSEKGILIEILNLSMLDKGCVASNNHFSELMGIKKEAVSRLISSLEKKGFIQSEIKAGSRNFQRTITINKMLFDYKQNVIESLTNCLETKENKTINKTINIVIEYLNSKTGKKFSSKSKDSMMIGTLLRSNYTEEDCKRVIDEKVSQWINNPDMSKYLRPNTLFGSKFDRYLNEALSSSKPQTKGKMVIGGKVV